jgi:putative transposase
MRTFKRLSHDIWQCKYHLVWCPKYRYRVLTSDVGTPVSELVRQLCQWKHVDILESNVQDDHIHMVVSVPPKYSISEVVGFLKGKSAIKVFDLHTELKKRYWGRHF